MSKLGLPLAVVALALGAYVAYESAAREERLARLEETLQLLQGSVGDLDAKLDRVASAAEAEEAAFLSAVADEAEGAETAPGATGLAGRRPPTAVERLATLEKTVARQRETIAKLEEKADAPQPTSTGRVFNPGNFYHSLDAAAKNLDLSERQKADMQDVIDLAKRELADLYKIENDNGETWEQVRKPKMAEVEGGSLQIAMPDFKKIAAFKKSRVPGTAETFGEAEKRIKDRAYADMRRGLTPEQGKKWDGAHKRGLLGGHGGDGAVMVSSIVLDTDGE